MKAGLNSVTATLQYKKRQSARTGSPCAALATGKTEGKRPALRETEGPIWTYTKLGTGFYVLLKASNTGRDKCKKAPMSASNSLNWPSRLGLRLELAQECTCLAARAICKSHFFLRVSSENAIANRRFSSMSFRASHGRAGEHSRGRELAVLAACSKLTAAEAEAAEACMACSPGSRPQNSRRILRLFEGEEAPSESSARCRSQRGLGLYFHFV